MPFQWLSRRWSRGQGAASAVADSDKLQLPKITDTAPRPMPALPWIGNHGLIWSQVRQLASFWEQPASGSKNLWQACYRLAQGLQHQHFAFLMHHQQGQLAVGWVSEPLSELRSLLETCYPGLKTATAPGGVRTLLATATPYPAAIQINGHPASPAPHEAGWESFDPPGLDALVQGLRSVNWLYAVLAWPVGQQQHECLLQQVYHQETEIRASYFRVGTSLEKNNPQAQAWLEQVEMEKVRLQEGLRTGLWDVAAILYLNRLENLGAPAGLLRSLFSGSSPQPQSLSLSLYLTNLEGAGAPFPPTRLNARDLARLMLIPQNSYQGYEVRPFSVFDQHQPQTKSRRQLFLGNLKSTGEPVYLERDNLAKHLLIAGTTGSGKTHACLSLLLQAWQVHRIPFVVLETSIKSEYAKKLKKLIGDDLSVFTVGDESGNPLHLDLLQVPPGIKVEAHMGHLSNTFKAAFTLPPPTPHLLNEALHIWYQRCGWEVDKNVYAPDAGKPLVFADLLSILEDLLFKKYRRYDQELRGNIEAALLARLSSLTRGSLGQFFASPPGKQTAWEDLMKKPVILELANITDPEQKALALLYILYRIRCRAQEEQNLPDRLHLTVIEEAHQVLSHQEVSKNPEVADAAGAAMQAFADALRLLREFREGFIILDQMPSRLSPAVRNNTNMKLALRLPEGEEQKIIAEGAGLDEGQKKLLYRLEPGEALWLPPTGAVYHVKLPEFSTD